MRENFSIKLAKTPGRLVITVILILNVAFILLASLLIKLLAVLPGTEDMGYWEAVYYTILMVLDGGCVTEVVGDVANTAVPLVIICIVVVMVGMVLFTGAVIGYLTNWISHFIEDANVGAHKLYLHDHTVILNWNTRASEIINDLLYCEGKQKIVVLVPSGKEDVERQIQERVEDTIAQENEKAVRDSENMGFFARRAYIRRHKIKNNLIVIVREGDTFSTLQLRDISIEHAKTIIILGNDETSSMCKYDYEHRLSELERGNPQIIKALVQVAEITGADYSDDGQKIVVEVEDEWTSELVNRIIENKQVDGKCKIIPVTINKVLGRLLSQFSLMPELNLAYRELFSNKGATFFSCEGKIIDEHERLSAFLSSHTHAIPLGLLEHNGKVSAYYSAEQEEDHDKIVESEPITYTVSLNKDYWLEQKNVVILGYNSHIHDIMEGFADFCKEWNKDGKPIVNLMVIDSQKHLEKMNYYREYDFVTSAVEAEVFDRTIICNTVEEFVDKTNGDVSVLILSDDTVSADKIDANAIANLIYIRDIISKKKREDANFDEGKIDIVVEINNPKHYDIVKSYSVNNIVISNRYISKMISQLGSKDDLYYFYNDILSYDEDISAGAESKEVYIKKVSRYFDELPAPCSAYELIRAVYTSAKEQDENIALVLGYVKKNGEMILFCGDQRKQMVELEPTDKLIMFSTH